jgi:endonuclease/exonuclease/phosphatase family metal-dependent hydrolase
MTLSLRRVINHLGRPPEWGVRRAVDHPIGPFTISAERISFSVMTHNMGLLVFPGNYLGTDRSGAISEIIAQIRSFRPDVVGLCEVFDNDERERIRNALVEDYPFWRDGPDEDDLESDGGLLMLSRHPLLAAGQTIFRDSDGADSFANKGVIHVRIMPQPSPVPIDLFYSHMQDIETDDGVNTLYAQLSAMNLFIGERAEPNSPRFIFGDLNIPAEHAGHYHQLLSRLDQPVDCWTLAGNAVASGFTYDVDNNFYDEPEDRPNVGHRLDYLLLKARPAAVPIICDIDVLKFRRNGRNISDHFGLHAAFDHVAITSNG